MSDRIIPKVNLSDVQNNGEGLFKMANVIGDRCPCCGKSTASTWSDKSLAEMDRAELFDVISHLQGQFDQVSDQFLRLAKLNQRILDRETARLTKAGAT